MGSVTKVGRVHSIWQFCHLQRTDFIQERTTFNHKRLYLRNWLTGSVFYVNSHDDDKGDDNDHEEDYPGDQLGGDLNVSSWDF